MLFPSVTSGFRSGTQQARSTVSDAIELGYHFTQRGMRRTFNDLVRAARVEAIVTRSISVIGLMTPKGAQACGGMKLPRGIRVPEHHLVLQGIGSEATFKAAVALQVVRPVCQVVLQRKKPALGRLLTT